MVKNYLLKHFRLLLLLLFFLAFLFLFSNNVNAVYSIDWKVTSSNTNSTTNVPIILFLNYVSPSVLSGYDCYYSYSAEGVAAEIDKNWSSCYIISNGSNKAYAANVCKNGTYVFKLINKTTKEERLFTYIVSNININSSSDVSEHVFLDFKSDFIDYLKTLPEWISGNYELLVSSWDNYISIRFIPKQEARYGIYCFQDRDYCFLMRNKISNVVYYEIFTSDYNNGIYNNFASYANGVTTTDWRDYLGVTVSNGKHTNYLYSTVDLYKYNNGWTNQLLYQSILFVQPSIAESEKNLSSLKNDYILCFPGSVDVSATDINFVIRERKTIDFEGGSYDKLEVVWNTTLNTTSKYYHSLNVDNTYQQWFEITISDIKAEYEFKAGSNYVFSLEYVDGFGKSKYIDYEVTMSAQNTNDFLEEGLSNLQTTISESNKQLLEASRETTAAINEQTEVNRGILGTIGNILSYINPFSENFFAYKLVELILDGFKGLFIPSDNFFENYFNNLMDFFSDRFGFLAYPFELAGTILNKFLSLNDMNAGFTIPEIKEPSTGQILIHETEFSFDTIVGSNEKFVEMHNMYLVFVDFIIGGALLALAIKKWNEVLSK